MPLVIVKSDKRAREKPCLRCGYSLRKIDALHCPECGLSVWRSLNQNDALDWSNPIWLKRLSIACALLAVTQGVGLVVYLLTNFLLVLRVRRVRGLFLAAWHFAPFLAAVYGVGLAVGLFLLAAEEGRYPDRWKPFKWGCRIVAGLEALLVLWTLAGGAVMFSRAPSPIVTGILPITINLAIIVGVVAAFAYLRKLAQRIPSSTAARLSGWLLFVPMAALLKFVPFFYFAFALFGWVFEYLPLLYLPLSTGLLIWFVRAFRKAAVAAQHGWDSETAGKGAPVGVRA